MMRQGGLFTANMNVEHVAATTQFSGNNKRIQSTRHNKESPVKQARLAISAKPFAKARFRDFQPARFPATRSATDILLKGRFTLCIPPDASILI